MRPRYGHLPQAGGMMLLTCAVLAEKHNEWMSCRRYMSLESLAKAGVKKIHGNAIESDEKEVK
ncbi:MAG: hypothetical protein ACUVRX_09500 [Actinomycetota bacterium]